MELEKRGPGRPKKDVAVPQAQALVMKGSRTALHHLFKSDIQKMLKNVSYKKDMPIIERLDHGHLFHSINSQMKIQDYTSAIGGHFHKIRWGLDAQGKPQILEVGPPLHYKYVRRPSGQKKILAPVAWRDGETEKEIVDTHTHRFEYVHSEEISESSTRAVQQDSFQALAQRAGLKESPGDDAA